MGADYNRPDFPQCFAVKSMNFELTNRSCTVLTFSQEVDLIWNRRWTFMTGLYFAARYCGSVSFFSTNTALNLRFSWTRKVPEITYIANQWINTVFSLSMQAILLVRVYALYNRSKKLLAFLLACFCCNAIVVLVISGMMYNFPVMGKYFLAVGPNSFGSVAEEDEVDPSAFEPLGVVDVMMQLTLDLILLALALSAAVKHTLEARRLHGGWSINPLVKSLIADQIIYFIGNIIWQAAVISLIFPDSIAAGSPIMLGLAFFFNGFVALAGPHMVISLRAQEHKTVEGTSHGELSTIQFGTGDLPASSVQEREPESEPAVGRGCGSARRQADEEA
ncbi:hypothetical protein BV22DRAFT_922382 [Leucogyrophana mollusca]|uniref:Uncharacterized protein n=1 Tax=Leucogyrophana mollusca TaxID=85980 RepID=A0ACB8AX34_9AGAM|nr:hypothetical protein BV22DRAFT_922382 [Leucogyrophana mollusca]